MHLGVQPMVASRRSTDGRFAVIAFQLCLSVCLSAGLPRQTQYNVRGAEKSGLRESRPVESLLDLTNAAQCAGTCNWARVHPDLGRGYIRIWGEGNIRIWGEGTSGFGVRVTPDSGRGYIRIGGEGTSRAAVGLRSSCIRIWGEGTSGCGARVHPALGLSHACHSIRDSAMHVTV